MKANAEKSKETSLFKNPRLKLNRKILIQDFLEQKTLSRGFPAHLKIELTSYCNLKCKVCPSRIMKRGEGFIDPNLFKSIIDQTKKTEFIYHHFMGESLFHPNVFELINYSKQKGIKTGLSTNATILDKEKAKEMIKSGLDFLVISFDGGSKETYDKICQAFAPADIIKAHMDVYGADNHLRLTGKHETQSIDKFSYGVSDRGASIRIPIATVEKGWKGWLEDRRPNSAADPYKVAARIIKTVHGVK